MGRDANKVQALGPKPTLESSPNTGAVQCCASSGKASWPVGRGMARSNKSMLDFISDHWGDVTTSSPPWGKGKDSALLYSSAHPVSGAGWLQIAFQLRAQDTPSLPCPSCQRWTLPAFPSSGSSSRTARPGEPVQAAAEEAGSSHSTLQEPVACGQGWPLQRLVSGVCGANSVGHC